MVKKCSAWYIKITPKFGFKLPKTVNEAVAINEKNANTLWQDEIEKEIENVKITFKMIPISDKAPTGYKHINCPWYLALKWRICMEKHT